MEERTILIVNDGLGVGSVDNAAAIRRGDAGSNTLDSITTDKSGNWPYLPNLSLSSLGMLPTSKPKCINTMEQPHTFYLDPGLPSAVQRHTDPPLDAVVVGAGRWGKILCSVLSDLSPAVTTIHLIARRNHPATIAWLAAKQDQGSLMNVRVVASLDQLLAESTVDMAVVSRLACEHFQTTRTLLEAGANVIVEKPFVSTTDEARELIAMANARCLRLGVGYEFMFSRALHHFREMIPVYLREIRSLQFVWADVLGIGKSELRKDLDPVMNVVSDIFPHILSELWLLFGEQPITHLDIQSRDGFRHANIRFALGGIPVSVVLDKEAAEAQRKIVANDVDGQSLTLDYTTEPGWVALDDSRLPPDRFAKWYSPSLIMEMAHFIECIRNPLLHIPNAASSTLPIVEATELAEHAFIVRQTEILQGVLYEDLSPAMPTKAMRIVRQHLIGPMLANGLVDNPKDDHIVNDWCERALRITHMLSREPWTTQDDILARERLDLGSLIRLNEAMQESDFLQNLIVNAGPAKKYWDTILPLIHIGAIDAVLTNTYQFPARVGIYPGLFCMFRCKFCGRVTNEHYHPSEVMNGQTIFNNIFSEMEASGNSTLSLAGGMEPLTYPKIGALIESAKRHGLRVPLITNGYLLTPQHVDQHPSLFELDLLRVSLYGVDDGTYQHVTGRRNAFTRVQFNVIEFLKERNRRESKVKFGFNFIILNHATDQVLRVLDVIHKINTAVNNGPGVDFLTLREDFSAPANAGLTAKQRKDLINILACFETKMLTLCPDLNVDYGYSLFPLSEGVVWQPLAMVESDRMLPRAYPQVSVAVDLRGDVFLYREAGFLNRQGADRYIIGRVTSSQSLESVIRDYLSSGKHMTPEPYDSVMMDAFDHVVTKTIWQGENDIQQGIPFNLGPISARVYNPAAQPSSGEPVNYWQRFRRDD